MKKAILSIFIIVTNSFSTGQKPEPPLNFNIPYAINGHPYLTWEANPANPSTPTVYYKMERLIDGTGYTENLIQRGVWKDVQGGLTGGDHLDYIPELSYQDNGFSVDSGEKAEYRVSSYQNGYYSDPTPIVTVGGIPSQPQSVTLSSSVGLNGPIRVSWQANPNSELIDSYEINRLVMNYPGVWEVMGTTTNTDWIDPQYDYAPVGGGWVASYKIRAIRGNQYSDYSAVASERAECMWKANAKNSAGQNTNLAAETPQKYSLNQNFPNPFNPSTTISFDLPKDSPVSLKIYDMVGHEIATLVDGYRPAGRYQFSFDAGKLSSGLYIYKIRAGEFSATKKMQMLK